MKLKRTKKRKTKEPHTKVADMGMNKVISKLDKLIKTLEMKVYAMFIKKPIPTKKIVPRKKKFTHISGMTKIESYNALQLNKIRAIKGSFG